MTPKFRDQPCTMCGTRDVFPTGAWCRAQRIAAGLSLPALAKRCGLAVATLGNVETGRDRCSVRVRQVYEALAHSGLRGQGAAGIDALRRDGLAVTSHGVPSQ